MSIQDLHTRTEDGGGPPYPTVAIGRYLYGGLAVLSVVTAAIHFAVMFGHFTQYLPFGVFFLALAWAQVGWSAAVLWRPSRPVLLAGAAGNAAVLVVYVVSRTTGVPVGPDAGTPEPVGGLDLFCAAVELALVAGCVSALSRTVTGRRARTGRARAVTAVAAGLVVAASAAMATPALAGPEGPAPAAGMNTAAQPMSMREVGSTAPPTAAQIAAADRLISQTGATLAAYRDVRAALAAGYRPAGGGGGEQHYVDIANMRYGLDPRHPQSLVYATGVPGHPPVLLGAMYIALPGTDGPQVGGSLTRWHEHSMQCLGGKLSVADTATSRSCSSASTPRYTAQMLHVWTVPDYPGGPFSDDLSQQAIRSAVAQALPDR